MFLLLGGIFVVMGYLGTILMREPRKGETRQLMEWVEDSKEEDAATKVCANCSRKNF